MDIDIDEYQKKKLRENEGIINLSFPIIRSAFRFYKMWLFSALPSVLVGMPVFIIFVTSFLDMDYMNKLTIVFFA